MIDHFRTTHAVYCDICSDALTLKAPKKYTNAELSPEAMKELQALGWHADKMRQTCKPCTLHGFNPGQGDG